MSSNCAAQDQIKLQGLTVRGWHGVYDEERENGQIFTTDLVMYLDTLPAAKGDDLDATVDYSKIAQLVGAVVAGEPVYLLETLAHRIADAVLSHERIERVVVTVHKPQVWLGVECEDVAVCVDRCQDDGRSISSGMNYAAFEAEAVDVDDTQQTGTKGEVENEKSAPQSNDVTQDEEADTVTPAFGIGTVLPSVIVDPALGAIPPVPMPQAELEQYAAPRVEVASYPVKPEEDKPQGVTEENVNKSPELSEHPDQLRDAPTDPRRVVIAMGANLGDRLATLREAILQLENIAGVEVTAISPLARTAPVLGEMQDPQPDFFNAVVVGKTMLAPLEVLAQLHRIESAYGRVREERWQARTLDLDLIDYEGCASTDPELILPHPRAHKRAFVLLPWSLVEPRAQLGTHGEVVVLAEYAPDRGGVRRLWDQWWIDSGPVPRGIVEPAADTGAQPLPQWSRINSAGKIRIIDDLDAGLKKSAAAQAMPHLEGIVAVQGEAQVGPNTTAQVKVEDQVPVHGDNSEPQESALTEEQLVTQSLAVPAAQPPPALAQTVEIGEKPEDLASRFVSEQLPEAADAVGDADAPAEPAVLTAGEIVEVAQTAPPPTTVKEENIEVKKPGIFKRLAGFFSAGSQEDRKSTAGVKTEEEELNWQANWRSVALSPAATPSTLGTPPPAVPPATKNGAE